MDLYEIQLLVGTTLNNNDLTRCILVCRSWHQSFTPLLYTAYSHNPSWPSFQKHLEHVRDLHVGEIHPDILQHCQLLTRLQFSLQSASSVSDLLGLLQKNSNLRHIDMHDFTLLGNYLEVMETIIQSCPRVTQLVLNKVRLDGAMFNKFSKMAARLTTLSLTYCWPVRESDATTHDGSWIPFPELRELKVVGPPKNIPFREQLGLFEKSSKLEALAWELVDKGPEWTVQFVRALCDKLQYRDKVEVGADTRISTGCCWPRLDSLKITDRVDLNRSMFSQDLLKELLESCPNSLRRFVSKNSRFGREGWPALQRHLPTLEVLHLATSGWTIQEIMASCPKLQEIKSGTIFAGDVADTVQAEAWRRYAADGRTRELNYEINTAKCMGKKDLVDKLKAYKVYWPEPSSPPRPWVCRGLRSFRVTMERMKDDDEANRQVFGRFAQLRKLEVINIRPGWAGQLGGFDTRKYPSYLGYVKSTANKDLRKTDNGDDISDDDDDDADDHFFHDELSPTQLLKLPLGSRMLEIWPELRICRLSK